jgi:hypothetical protein
MKHIPPSTTIYRRRLLALYLAGACLTSNANAILMPSLSNYDAHKALSDDPKFRFAASIEVTRADGTILRSSGVAIAPNIVLTAAHVVPSTTSTATVTGVMFGPNVFVPGALRLSAVSWERYPGYIFGSSNYHTLDFGLVYLDGFISGLTPVAFGPATLGQVVTIVGYGRFAELNASTSQESLGDRLAGHAPVSGISSQWPSISYLNTFLAPDSPANSLNATALPGDSGGPVFDEDGRILGIHTGQMNGFSFGLGTALRTSNPDFLNFVTPRIAVSWAAYYAQRQPELSDVSIQPSAASHPPTFSGTVTNGPPLGTAQLQASLDLGTTDP